MTTKERAERRWEKLVKEKYGLTMKRDTVVAMSYYYNVTTPIYCITIKTATLKMQETGSSYRVAEGRLAKALWRASHLWSNNLRRVGNAKAR